MVWDAQASRLRCTYCGSVAEVGHAPVAAGSGIVEYDLVAALGASHPRGTLGAGKKQLECTRCGASVEFPDHVIAGRCDFCDSPQVVPQDARADLYVPDSLVPFVIDRERAAALFRGWLGRLWFRPSDLEQKASVAELHGVYVPYWTFDATVASHWNADAGHYYYVTEHYTEVVDGRSVSKTRQSRRVRWEPASGARTDGYNDVLVCASRGLPEDLASSVATFDTRALVPYAPAYLQVLVNGQTGWLKGKAPYSFWKILLACLAVIFALACLAALSSLHSAAQQRP